MRAARPLRQIKDQPALQALRHDDPELAGTLAKGLMILQCFVENPHPLGNSQLAERLALPRSTVSRLCRTLQCLGFLDHDDRVDRYLIGPAAVPLGYPCMINVPTGAQTRAAMQALADRFLGAASISVVMGLDVVYLATAAHKRGTLKRPGPGAVRGVMENAMGRAWLATQDASRRGPFLEGYRSARPEQYERCIADVEESIEAYGRRGFAVNAGLGVLGAGVASRIRYGSRCLLFNCASSAAGLRTQDVHEKVGPAVVQLVEFAHKDASTG
ncbi:helix-turn-helix domain-containing protein [Piscinibacter sakaiensis]|uniref:Transcriptional regulator, IclR family n=1 Tax=Piscinibacter sakaiensis TaxID=1547922 RepID=A0A0K8NUQ7_PISS1|nr:helix-turn-helix domain-containing protein [Piscinibacter sakaiensis]GAP33660.1 transcriptional regulator, IclR family [Piscinibacter sakaiensis]